MKEKPTLFIHSISDEVNSANQKTYSTRIKKNISSKESDLNSNKNELKIQNQKNTKKVTPPIREENDNLEITEVKQENIELTLSETEKIVDISKKNNSYLKIYEKLKLIARRSEMERPVYVDLYTVDEKYRGYVSKLIDNSIIIIDDNNEEQSLKINTINKVMILEL